MLHVAGPDANRPSEPQAAKAASEKLLTSAMFDISTAASIEALRDGLGGISLLCSTVGNPILPYYASAPVKVLPFKHQPASKMCCAQEP